MKKALLIVWLEKWDSNIESAKKEILKELPENKKQTVESLIGVLNYEDSECLIQLHEAQSEINKLKELLQEK